MNGYVLRFVGDSTVDLESRIRFDFANASAACRLVGFTQGHGEVALELGDKVDGDTCMHSPLLVEKCDVVLEREDGLVPDSRVEIDAEGSIAVEGDEVIRRDVVAG